MINHLRNNCMMGKGVRCTSEVNLGLILAVRVAGVGCVQMLENTDSRGSYTHHRRREMRGQIKEGGELEKGRNS